MKAFALCSNCRLLDKILIEGVTVGRVGARLFVVGNSFWLVPTPNR